MSEPPSDSRYRPFPVFAQWGVSFDTGLVDSYRERLQEAKLRTSEQDLDRAVRVATRTAAVDTGAIEGLYTVDRGFTRTIATEAAAWEATLEARDPGVARSIRDALAAYDQVLDAVTHDRPVTEVWIRELHATLCRSQESYVVHTGIGPQKQTLPTGVYKTMANSPTNPSTGTVHHYAPPSDTPSEMQRLVSELRSSAFLAAHPVAQAAWAHYAFVCVHPFADGNGRVARALASAYLYRSPGVPLVVFADQRDRYLDALEIVDAGNPAPFVSFVEQRAIDAVELVLGTLPSRVPPAAESLAKASGRANGRGGLTADQIDALVGRLLKLAEGAFSARCREVLPDNQFAFHWEEGYRAFIAVQERVEGYPQVIGKVWAEVNSKPPRDALVVRQVSVRLAEQHTKGADFVLVAERDPMARVFVRDLHPAETEVLRLKLEDWARQLVDELVAELAAVLTQPNGF